MATSDRTLLDLRRAFLAGHVIPAHPLALTSDRRLDERRQVALTRYYCDAGAGGIAVGVHTTQFAIRDPSIGLLAPVLELASRTVKAWCGDRRERPLMIAGVCGQTPQALGEATLAVSHGYDAALLSVAALRDAANASILDHCRRIADIIPVVGFYLQPAVGGRVLDRDFWRGFFEIEGVVAVKVAPFDRYRTLDVVAALIESGRTDVALYTGNDDAIVADLLTPFSAGDGRPPVHFAGGLLGQWAVWTRRAVEMLQRSHAVTRGDAAPQQNGDVLRLLSIGADLTDANAALFDPAHQFAGCIPGIHEVLRRQGLLAGRWCLDPHEELSPGQEADIDRVLAAYPHLTDDRFVREHLDRWLA
jgi:dihydrodipicolinate synthase/N-acetylneuraminate lyase